MHWDEPVAIDFESKGSVFFMVSEEKKDPIHTKVYRV
jgi:hypothetical protein